MLSISSRFAIQHRLQKRIKILVVGHCRRFRENRRRSAWQPSLAVPGQRPRLHNPQSQTKNGTSGFRPPRRKTAMMPCTKDCRRPFRYPPRHRKSLSLSLGRRCPQSLPRGSKVGCKRKVVKFRFQQLGKDRLPAGFPLPGYGPGRCPVGKRVGHRPRLAGQENGFVVLPSSFHLRGIWHGRALFDFNPSIFKATPHQRQEPV